jgi:hypothetical protein
MAVGDPPGQLQLVPEALDDPLARGDLGVQNLEGYELLDFGIEGLVNSPHAALSQFLHDLVAPGEGGPDRQLRLGRHEGGGLGKGR